jgi:nicotinamide-nucleotide amidase
MDHLLPAAIADLAERVVKANIAAGRCVALAESCTGGLVAAAITEVAGCSAIFDRSFVTYSNEAKQDLLGVPADLIDTFGAVSAAVAWAMAQGALQNSNADVAVAVTGVAGPDGGTVQKPVGTVVFARAVRGQPPETCSAEVRIFENAKTRSEVRHAATIVALELLMPDAQIESGCG